MVNESLYETYLYLSNKSFFLCVIQMSNSVIIYERKILLDQKTNQLDYEKLYNFLDNSVYKIEKKLKHFIKDINIILEVEEFFPIQISIKDNNNGNILTSESLTYSLNETKKLCAKTFEKNKIIHMLIDNYQINNKNYTSLPENLQCENFSLDVRFICISQNIITNLEQTLKKFQISINRVLNSHYVKSLFGNDKQNLFLKAQKIIDGFNENEIKFHKKNIENKGFFEKFFNFFS